MSLQLLTTERLNEEKKFWLNKLSGTLTRASLPFENSRRDNTLYRQGKYSVKLPDKLTEKLLSISNGSDKRLHMIFISSVTALIYRYNNTEEIILGAPIYRQKERMRNQMIPLRNRVQGNMTLIQLLLGTKEIVTEAYQHPNYPIKQLIPKLKLEEEHPQGGLFNIAVSLEPLHDSSYFIELQLPMLFRFIKNREELELDLIYNEYLYDKEDVIRIQEHFFHLLTSGLENRDISISKLEMLSVKEKNLLLHSFNNTQTEYPADQTIHQLFEKQAARVPEQMALIFNDKTLSYSDLNKKANQIATLLKNKGVGSGMSVGIMIERSFDMIGGMLGILKLGAAYVPIDGDYPINRIYYMLKDSGATHILTTSATKIEAENVTVVKVEEAEKLEAECFESDGNPENTAYMIYTSGSTGNPKGVVIQHKAVINTLWWHSKYYELSEKDRILQLASISFDCSVEDIFSALISGAGLVLIDRYDRFHIEALKRHIIDGKVTHFTTVPSFYHMLLKEIGTELSCLKSVTVAGEACLKSLVQLHYQILPEVALYNEYGPTENSINTTVCKLDKNETAVTIGKPIANTKCYILDKDKVLLPIGVCGELCISGPGLAKEYRNNNELTKGRFIAHPFRDKEKLYRTGDICRWMPDGTIEFLGRQDDQVKIRGYRIQLTEIETTILELKAVSQAAVTVSEEQEGVPALCAYVESNQENIIAELSEYLRKKLPEYMIPQYYIKMKEFPRTTSGKLDKKALPKPAGNGVLRQQCEVPTDEIGIKLAGLWAEILNIPVKQIGMDSDFFELGGQSLKATILLNRIHKNFSVDMPLAVLFQRSKLKEFASYLKETEKTNFSEIKPAIKRDSGYYAVSSAQKRLFIIDQFKAAKESYHVTGVFEAVGSLDKERLNQAFKMLINRHEILRTSFELVDGEPMQLIHGHVDFQIEYSEGTFGDMDEIISNFMKPYDLKKAPLLRVLVNNYSESNFIIVLDMHHIISDGMSEDILIRDFASFYEGIELEPLSIQYKDFAEWQNRYFNSELLKKQEEYWLHVLSGELPILDLPVDFQRTLQKDYAGDSITFTLNERITKGLTGLAADTNATLHMVLLSVYKILLSKYTGQNDIIIGMPIAGRRHSDLDNIIGMFVNTLALRLNTDQSMNYREILGIVRECSLQAYENQDYQFEMLVDQLDLQRDISRNPVFDTMFVLQNMEVRPIQFKDLTVKQLKYRDKTTKFDLILTAVQRDGEIIIDLEYRTSLFKEETVRRLSGYFIRIAEQISENPQIPYEEIQLLSEEEKNLIQKEFNDTSAWYPADKTIHQLFEEQAARTSDNAALIFGTEYMTYGELNEEANRIASLLQRRGVKSGSVVGIMMDRSFALISGMLGILKANAAYLPLDPQYPSERIDYMLRDSHAYALLTTKTQELPKTNISVIYTEDSAAENYEIVATDTASSENPAYIIYTSGSTGKPKGVMIRHKSIVNTLYWRSRYYNYSAADRILQIPSVSFDSSVEDIFTTLISGAVLVLIEAEKRLDMKYLENTITKNFITHLLMVPSFYRSCLEQLKDRMKGLKAVTLAGESCQKKLISSHFTYLPNTKLYNEYGPTENSVCTTIYEFDRNCYERIGKPIANTRCYVLDERKELLPMGAYGELYVAGNGVSDGYMNQPELTEEKFLMLPDLEQERLYRTGDFVRWLPDGNLEFKGRMDNQVKIRGFRIELGEIEREINKIPLIKASIVLAVKSEDESYSLTAYLVSEPELDMTRLRIQLMKTLPDYMIPAFFVRLEQFPTLSNGKIDQKALLLMERKSITEEDFLPPATKEEEAIARICSEILGVDQVSMSDNFFEIGGNSIKAIQLISKIESTLSVELPIAEVFGQPNLRELSSLITTLQKKNLIVIPPAEEREYYELSQQQLRLYTLQQMNPESTSYNISGAIRLDTEQLDQERLESAFHKIVKRHSILRTNFIQTKHGIVQVLRKSENFKPEYYLEECQDKKSVVEDFIRPYHLEKDELFRVRVIFVKNNYFILFDLHHIIADGITLQIIMKELEAFYQNKELPEVKLQYRDYSQWQKSEAHGELMMKQERYWLRVFEDPIPILNLPTDFTRPPVKNDKGGIVSFQLSSEQSEKIRAFTKSTNSSLMMYLLTVYHILLHKYSGQDDIVIGIPVLGRNLSGLMEVVGNFVNMVAIRNKSKESMSFIEFFNYVRANCILAYENQDYQFDSLLNRLNPKNDPSRNPIFDVALNILMNEEKDEELEEICGNMNYTDVKYDLFLRAIDRQETELSLEYADSLFKEQTIITMSEHLKEIIDQVLDNPYLEMKEIRLSHKFCFIDKKTASEEVDFQF